MMASLDTTKGPDLIFLTPRINQLLAYLLVQAANKQPKFRIQNSSLNPKLSNFGPDRRSQLYEHMYIN